MIELEKFKKIMHQKLLSNQHKGTWKEDSAQMLFRRAGEEMFELQDAIRAWLLTEDLEEKEKLKILVAHEAADVANFCMMISDIVGAL